MSPGWWAQMHCKKHTNKELEAAARGFSRAVHWILDKHHNVSAIVEVHTDGCVNAEYFPVVNGLATRSYFGALTKPEIVAAKQRFETFNTDAWHMLGKTYRVIWVYRSAELEFRHGNHRETAKFQVRT